MSIKFPITLSCLVFINWISSGIVLADGKVADYFAMSPFELAEMPVTIATGTPKPVFQSAATTSVVTADQIKSMGATQLHEVLETVPGVHASLQPNSYDYNYSIRGIANSTNSEVLILLNGTRITTPFGGTLTSGTEIPVEAIQQVEVIRGPGSALYGADAFAGVINIITKKAKDINGTVLGVRAGDHGTQSGWGQQSVEWGGWNVATSLQYQHSDGDNGRRVNADTQTVFDNVFGTQASLAPGSMNTNYETYNGHLNLQRKHWDLGFWAYNNDFGARAGAAGALDPTGSADGAQYLGDARFSTEDWLTDWELTAHASYLQADFQGQFKLFPNNAKLPVGADGNLFSAKSALVLFPSGVATNLGRTERIPSLELGSIYKGFDKHLLRFSTAFRYESVNANQSSNFGYGTQNGVGGALVNVTGTSYSYLPDTHRTVGSLVAQDEWQLAADWQLTAGLRYDHYSDFGGTFNPRAALVWDINKQFTSKLMYGKAFRAPNFSEQFTQNNPVVQGNPNLRPETINTYEWALNYRPWSSLSTGVNVYYYQINNLIAEVGNSGAGAANIYQNSGNLNGYGSEFEFNWQWSEQWNIKGNYAWQHAVNETAHSLVTGVPASHVYAALVWKFLPQWQIQPQLNWIAGRTGMAGEIQQLSNYETIDFTLRGKQLFEHLNLAASLRNALNTNYYEPTALQLPTTLPMPGRSFYLEASVNF